MGDCPERTETLDIDSEKRMVFTVRTTNTICEQEMGGTDVDLDRCG